MLSGRIGALLALLALSCSPAEEKPAFPGLVPLSYEPLSLEVAEAHSSWIPVDGGTFWQFPAQPLPIGDVNGDGCLDFAVHRELSGEAGIELAIHDGDGCDDYLLRAEVSSTGRRWQTKRVDFQTISGRTGKVLAKRSWEAPAHEPRIQGVFTVAGEGNTPVLLAYGKRTRVRSAFRKSPRDQIVEPYAYLIDPMDLEPSRFLDWESFPRDLDGHHCWFDWIGDGLAEGITFASGPIEIRSSRSGRRLWRTEKQVESNQVGYWECESRAELRLGTRYVFHGPSIGEVSAYEIGTGNLSYSRRMESGQWFLVHGLLPVQDHDGDGEIDLHAAVRIFRRNPGRMAHEFVTISGATGQVLREP